MSRRRQFLGCIPLVVAGGTGLAALLASRPARAALIDEQDPRAQKLGYRADSAKVDPQKFPTHKPAQTCANCQLYTGDPGSAAGGCVLFGDAQVAAKGWCTSWEQG